MGVGEAYEVVTSTRLAELAARQPAPWIPDRAEHTIAIPRNASPAGGCT